MIEHREPAEAVHRIRVMHDALYNFKHDLLGAGAPGVTVRPDALALKPFVAEAPLCVTLDAWPRLLGGRCNLQRCWWV